MKMTKKDWMTMRLLFLMMQDPTTTKLPDVEKTLDYYRSNKISIEDCFGKLWEEYMNSDVFNAPDIDYCRKLQNTVNIHSKEEWAPTQINEQWIRN